MSRHGLSPSGRERTGTEVFTPEWLVVEMCDALERENPGEDVFSPWRTFLEPSCGDGNFIVEILRRKFMRCKTRRDYTTALESVYGMDIQADNVEDCIRRVTALCCEYFKPTHQELEIITNHYIMCDSLKIMRMMNDERLQCRKGESATG